MRPNSEILGLPKGTEALLRDLVHERTGIFFDISRTDVLMEKLSPLVIKRGFSSFLDYYYLLKYDEASDVEWRNVMNALSVQETYFWREIDQVQALVSAILPQWTAEHPGKTFRIWSAACATGEEPLTIAMALQEEGWFQRVSIEIMASDASSVAIEKARAGIYRDRAFRNLSQDRLHKYFVPETSSSWRFRADLRERIRYSVANLVNENEITGLATANVIFCRNVFIYFSDASISRVVRSFSRLMPTPGYLFVGASESLMRLTSDLVLEDVDGAFVYLKESRSVYT
jgi:chemotaxis protein methyltransferase CheR